MSSKFENALKATMNDEVSITENGACGFKTSGKKLLDINFAVSSLRAKSEDEIEKMYSDAFYENPLLALKWLFMLRDIRGTGMGERRSFRVCFTWLALQRTEIAQKLVPLIAEYGRWDDLLCLLDTPLRDVVVETIASQLKDDIVNANESKHVSLLAKWMPSNNTSSAETRSKAAILQNALGLSPRQYRKALSKLRAYLKVIEVKMSAKQWNEIDYEAVPSKANIKYNAAFLRNDEARRRAYLGALEKGEAKINSSANFPCDIVSVYTSKCDSYYYGTRITKDAALEAMWKALPDYTKGLDKSSTIVVADGSGSMTTKVSGKMSALDVANSLAIYFAEKLDGVFKDKYITFSERPQYVDMTKAKSLAEKLNIAFKHNECANTNVEAVFDLMLETAQRNNLKQDDIPANVLIVSDMAFDQGSSWGNSRYWDSRYSAKRNALFESIKRKWQNAGYKLPRLVYWNVASGAKGAIPLQENEMGVALVSGYSPAIANMVFSTKLDPYEILVDALNVARYQPVEDAIKNLI